LGKPKKKNYSREAGTPLSKADIRRHANRTERREARQFLKDGIKILSDNPESFDRLEKVRKFSDNNVELRDWE
jgi:hypothetical protein